MQKPGKAKCRKETKMTEKYEYTSFMDAIATLIEEITYESNTKGYNDCPIEKEHLRKIVKKLIEASEELEKIMLILTNAERKRHRFNKSSEGYNQHKCFFSEKHPLP